jgi:hypothetical protein
MGQTNSKWDNDSRRQNEYINKRKKDKDIIKLSQMRGNLWHPEANKYNDFQIKGYLRQEYHGRRTRDSYVLENDLHSAGVSRKGFR